MTPEAWFTAALVLGMLAVLAFTRAAPDFVFMAAVVVLLLTGIVSPQQAFAGFSNQGVITVAALYVVVAGLAVIVLFNRQLFPDRRPAIAETDDPREYSLEMIVAPGGLLVGKAIEEAGLRHLAGGFLMELERGETRIPAVSPKERLQSGHHLIFVGVIESMVDLQRIRGLLPAMNQIFKLGRAPGRAGAGRGRFQLP
jgi:hypothetical protein